MSWSFQIKFSKFTEEQRTSKILFENFKDWELIGSKYSYYILL